MIETIYYKPQIGKATKDVLREINLADQNYLKLVMDCYEQLSSLDSEFNEIFDEPQPRTILPVQKQLGNIPNTPRTFCRGITDKLNQAHNRRDLSPKQCDGIEKLSRAFSRYFGEDRCPAIVFENKLNKNIESQRPKMFEKLFDKTAL